ncbi:MAG: DUF5717 family protein [Defluviitaleaceae bacterium]|nr:DUF5717 family protein [Defluviitaleaceae bacterium]
MDRLERLHRQFIAQDNTRTATIYSLGNWLAYRFAARPDNIYLERAYHGAMTAHRRNEPNVRLLTLAIFMATESGHFDIAGTMLEKAFAYRKFLMSNEPFYYGALCFLRAYLAIKQQKTRAAKKYHKAFTAYVQGEDYSPHYDVMEGQLNLAAYDYPQAYGYLARAYDAGCRNVYISEGLYRCYINGYSGNELHRIQAYATRHNAPPHPRHPGCMGEQQTCSLFATSPGLEPESLAPSPTTKIDPQTSLTQFEITPPPDTRYIYISQPEKKGMEEYEVDSISLIINATDNFTYVCLGAGRRHIIDTTPNIRRVLPQATPELYHHYYNQGDRRFQVLAYLASHYLAYPTADAIPVFEDILEEKILPIPYRTKLLISLGHLYYQQGRLPQALDCYDKIELPGAEGIDLEIILKAYLQSNNYDMAAEIIARHHDIIPAKTVYEAIHRLPAYPSLSQAVYNLLLSGHISDALLTFTLTHHQASHREWIALAKAIQTPDPHLDTKILSTGLWSHQYDSHTQKAFRRLYSAGEAQKECDDFVELLIFAILSRDLVPEYETINTLEKVYLSEEKDFFLLLALCHVYLAHKITTLRSDKIIPLAISAQEEMGILLPAFKENKPHPHPYLEKYQPFLFKAPPGKDIQLYFSLGQETEFKNIPMEYLRYGLYTAKLPLFYNETITYYYSEERETGSIATPHATYKNVIPYLNENHPDKYFAINNALVYEQMFRHEMAEGIVESLIDEVSLVSGELL